MQPSVLDDKIAASAIDRGNMLRVLEETPEAYEQAYSAALDSDTLPRTAARSPSNLTLVGIGGSAIAADIVKDWLFESPTSIEVIRGSRLPGSVTAGTYVLITSYSGHTAEPLKALNEARRRKSRVSCIASEGELLQVCRENRLPHVPVRTGLQPREALPDLLCASLATLEKWKICGHKSVRAELSTVVKQLGEVRDAIRFARPKSENSAKQLALQLQGTIPFIYASQFLASAGRRFKNQLNENSKVLAKFEVLPEMLHNEVQGWHMLEEKEFADLTSFVFLRGCETEDGAEQFDRLTSLIRQEGGRAYEIFLNSRTRLSSILATIYYCDYVSFYLATARGVDPTPIDTIRLLKESIGSPTA
jgi:glucose/mannose-6-phosphate isomerase